jgi:hypothetical protein
MSSDNAISFTVSSPVTGSTGCAPGPPEPDPPEPDPPPATVAGPPVERGDGVTAAGDDVADGAAGPDGCAAEGAGVEAGGFDVVPRCEAECESWCDASRIATLSKATVNVTRRLNRITSTRNALVCTV